MKKIRYLEPHELVTEAEKKINDVNTIFDIGCGIRPQNLASTFIHICIDAHKQYLDIVKKNNKRRLKFKFLYFNKTTDWVISKIPEKEVDSIFFLDVIEHVEKEHGVELIKAFSKIARHQIVIFTPLGFIKQEHPDGKDAWGLDGGKWQEHKSGWTPDDFDDDFDDDWEFLVCENFHQTDNLGNQREHPAGAFFAIKTMAANPELISRKNIFSKIYFTLKLLRKYRKLSTL